jgi:hypothetical protein
MKKTLLLILGLCICGSAFSQQINWTGNALNNNFFDENNWLDSNTSLPPAAGTIDSGQAINLDLQLHNTGAAIILANGIINLGTGALSVTSSNLEANAFLGGSVSVNANAYIDLSSNTPFQNNVLIDFKSGISWVRVLNLIGTIVLNNHLLQITVDSAPSVYETNLRLDNYYLNGTVIRSNNLATTPLTIYDGENFQGTLTNLSVDVVHTGDNIENTMNNKAESFILKKGYMATFADNDDGTGPSKNYIASESDLIVNELPNYLQNKISFLRVVPWNWVTKKGRASTNLDGALNETWNYQWNNNKTSTIQVEYVPMAWGGDSANDDADITLYKSKYKATHVLAFNESDNCNDQSGQFIPSGYTAKLCDTDVAVDLYKNLMKTGLRLVSPSGREGAPFDWLKEFHDKANAQDIRIDVIGVHWYDWGSNPVANPNPTALQVFNRFKTYLTNVHNLYGLPIWITEFNANPNRNTAINLAFMELALPYLESLPYVERYCWYQPNSGTADYYTDTTETTLTDVGTFYKNQVSAKSISGSIGSVDSNLDIYYDATNPTGNNLLVNGDFEIGDLTGWSGTNTGILITPNENVYEGTTTGRILANTGNLQQTVTVEALENYNLSFYTKWFVVPSTPIVVQILNAGTNAIIASKLMTTSIDWNLIELNFTVPAGVTSVKFYVEKGASSPGWFVDNVLLQKSTTLSSSQFDLNSFKIYPNPSSGVFVINGKTAMKSYAIYDMQGQLIKSKSSIDSVSANVDLSNHKAGIYLLVVKDVNELKYTNKLVHN